MALIVGVDIGQSSLKVVVLRTLVRGYAPVLYHCVPFPASPRPRPAAESAAALAALTEEGVPRGETVVSAVSGSVASVHFMDIPFTDRKKIEKVIPFEVESYVPFPLEGMRIAHQVIEKKANGVRVVVAVAPSEVLGAALDGLRGAGLDPWVIDCDLAALATLGAARVPADPGAGTYAILDLGAAHTGLVVIAGGRLVVARSLGASGNGVTAGLGGALGIPFEEAERIKVEFGSAVGLEAGLAAEPSGDARRIAEGIRAGIDAIAKEVKLALAAAEAKEKSAIERILLVGGGARLDGVVPYLGRVLGVEVRLLDLGDLPAGEPAPGPEAGCALGLALRGVRGISGSGLNFRRGEIAYRRETREIVERILPAAWPVAVLLVLALASFLTHWILISSRFESLRLERSSLFQEAFRSPEGPEPIRQAKLLIEERRKKIALLGGESGPLEVLREIATRIPAEAHVTVNEFEANPEGITFTAIANSFDWAGKVRNELGKCPSFAKVEVANQAKDKDRVRFTVSIQLTKGAE